MKKALKVGLAILAASSLASSAYAEVKGSITGRANVGIISYGGDGASYMDMFGNGRLGYTVSAKAGSWTATAKTEIDSSGVARRDQYVKVENDSMSYKIGHHYRGGSLMGASYAGEVSGIYWPGAGGRNQTLVIGLKNVGLDVIVGFNKIDDSPDATGDTYKQQIIGARYGGSAGNIKYKAGYEMQSGSVDVKDTDMIANGKWDGFAKSVIDFGVSVGMGKLTISGALDSISTKSGVSGATADTATNIVLGVDMDMGSGSGLSAFSTSKSSKSGSTTTTESNLTVAYKMMIGPVPLYIGYSSNTTEASSSSQMGANFTYGF